MKKILLISFLTVVISYTCVNAQLIKQYGLKAALTTASQSFEHSSGIYLIGLEGKSLRRTGFNIAFFIEWIDSSFFSIISQIEYTQRGRGWGPELIILDPGPIFKRDQNEYFRLDYISIPILIKIPIPISKYKPFFILGPRFDYFLGYASDDNNLYVDDIYNGFKKIIYGGSFGIGFDFEFIMPLTIEFRRNIDFIDSYKNNFLNIKNDSYDLWLGVAL